MVSGSNSPRVIKAIGMIRNWHSNKKSTTLVKIAGECFVSYDHVKYHSMIIGRELNAK